MHSFGGAAPPFTVHSTAFQTALVEQLGERVDLDEVSLDMARYFDPDMQEAIVGYLEKRRAKWTPDLVVPIGSPAAVFVAKYRQRLFADTPVLYTSLDRRLLPADALEKNAAYIGQVFNLPALIDDMVRIAPATRHIAVVVGATPLEQFWKQAFQKAMEPLSNKITATYWDDLSFDEMLKRASNLPPNSYIFVLLLLRDAAGVTLNEDEAIEKLHAASNAPINGIFDHEMGLGIVGGRLYQSERIGKVAAEMAVRILHGESASNFQPELIPPLSPRYDWRELQRWKIDEKQLPAGSVILYRPPSAWQMYRGWIVVGVSLLVIETVLISAFLANLVRRRRAERSLTESEARFQRMADAAPVMMWMSGPDKLCTFLNKLWFNFTGRSPEQELGNGWSEGVHSNDLAQCLATYSTSFDARQPFTMQYRLRRHDGEYRCISDSGVPRYNANGEFCGYIGTCVDVTDLFEKEEQLRESEERIALAADAAQLGGWELDLQTNKMWMSEQTRSLFQFTAGGEISLADFRSRVHPQDREAHEDAIKRCIDSNGHYEAEYRVLLPDGTQRWIVGRGRCIQNLEGKYTRLVGVSADITDRRQAQELFRFATEASPNGIVLVDEKGRIILVNTHIEQLFGYQREELIGRRADFMVGKRFRHEHRAGIVQYLQNPIKKIIGTGPELFGERKDGSEFPIEAELTPIQTPRGTLILISVEDMTSRKNAEAEAQRRRDEIDLLTRMSLLGEMSASIAHELNQPLSAIISNASAAQRFMERGAIDPENLHEILADVISDGRRAHTVIDNIRTTIKKGGATRKHVNLNDIVTGVAHLIQPDALAHSCQLRTRLAANLPPIDGDPVQIQQVLINLVTNAFDAMRETPMENRQVDVVTNPNGNQTVCVTVRDHGPGISAEARTHLFEQFYTTKADGLGMGLAIVRSIIEGHAGKIEVENAEGGGACFTFTLPIANHSSN